MNMKTKKLQQNVVTSIPVWTISNGLSFIRLLLVIPVFLLLLDAPSNRWFVLSLGFVAYLSDLSDGFVARKFGQESGFGRIIDPLADKVFIAGTIIALLLQHLIPLWFVLIVIGRAALIFIGGVYLQRKKSILIQSNLMGKIAVVSVGLILVLSLFRTSVQETLYSMMLILSLGFLAASLYMYIERFFKLLRKG